MVQFQLEANVVSSLITLLLATMMIHFAARFVLDRSSLFSAFFTALLGTLLASAVWWFIGGTLGVVLAVAAWAAVAAILFSTNWIKGAIIGLVAWVLWLLINYVVERLFR